MFIIKFLAYLAFQALGTFCGFQAVKQHEDYLKTNSSSKLACCLFNFMTYGVCMASMIAVLLFYGKL